MVTKETAFGIVCRNTQADDVLHWQILFRVPYGSCRCHLEVNTTGAHTLLSVGANANSLQMGSAEFAHAEHYFKMFVPKFPVDLVDRAGIYRFTFFTFLSPSVTSFTSLDLDL